MTALETGSSEATGWSEAEEAIAREAFERAQERAIGAIVAALRSQVEELRSAESLWRLHDFLSQQRHEIEGRFDFRPASLLFVFASLVRDGLMGLEELEGLDPLKLAKIAALARM